MARVSTGGSATSSPPATRTTSDKRPPSSPKLTRSPIGSSTGASARTASKRAFAALAAEHHTLFDAGVLADPEILGELGRTERLGVIALKKAQPQEAVVQLANAIQIKRASDSRSCGDSPAARWLWRARR